MRIFKYQIDFWNWGIQIHKKILKFSDGAWAATLVWNYFYPWRRVKKI